MGKVYFIPNGPKNLSQLFPAVDWPQVEEYYTEVLDNNNSVVATTSPVQIGGCDDDIRICFVNYLGAIDGVNMKYSREHDAKSSAYQVPLTYPLVKSQQGISRSSIKGNDIYTATTCDYGEAEMAWLEELLDAPAAWIEWKGTQGQPDDYIPIIISDGKIESRKDDDRFSYEVSIQFTLSNPRISLR